jgi:hypothetical protein
VICLMKQTCCASFIRSNWLSHDLGGIPAEAVRPWSERCCSCEFCIQCTSHLCFLSIGGKSYYFFFFAAIGMLCLYLQDVNDMNVVISNFTIYMNLASYLHALLWVQSDRCGVSRFHILHCPRDERVHTRGD